MSSPVQVRMAEPNWETSGHEQCERSFTIQNLTDEALKVEVRPELPPGLDQWASFVFGDLRFQLDPQGDPHREESVHFTLNVAEPPPGEYRVWFRLYWSSLDARLSGTEEGQPFTIRKQAPKPPPAPSPAPPPIEPTPEVQVPPPFGPRKSRWKTALAVVALLLMLLGALLLVWGGYELWMTESSTAASESSSPEPPAAEPGSPPAGPEEKFKLMPADPNSGTG